MRLLQKIEIGLGIAFFVSLLASVYFVDLPLARSIAEKYNEPLKLGVFFLIFILPPLLVAICSYFHAVRKSYIALVVLLIISGGISFFIATYALISGLFSKHPLIGTLPFFLGIATMFVAVANTIYFLRETESSNDREIGGKLKLSYRLDFFLE